MEDPTIKQPANKLLPHKRDVDAQNWPDGLSDTAANDIAILDTRSASSGGARMQCRTVGTIHNLDERDNRCIRYILDKNGCSYEDLPAWIFDPETRSSKNFPAVCSEGANTQVSSVQSAIESQKATSSQPRPYSATQLTSSQSQSQSKGQSGFQYSEARLRQLASSLESTTGSTYSGAQLGSLTGQSRMPEPWSYAYKMMYSQVPLFLVYAIQPYDLSQAEYKTEGLAKNTATAKEGTLNGFLDNEALTVINEDGMKKISAPFLTWYSSKKGSQEEQSQAKRRVTRNGGWHATQQSASAALSEAAVQQTSEEQQSSAARDSGVSSRGLYRESSHEFGQLGASDTSAEQQQEHSSQEEGAVQTGEAAEAQQTLPEAPSASAQSNLFADQGSGQQTASSSSWSSAIHHQKISQTGGTKGGTKGLLRPWTRNNLGYSG